MPEDAPTHPPIDVQVLEVGTHNVSLMWAPPPEEFQNGVIRTYTINASEVETERSFIVHTSDLVYTLLHLHPYYTYNFTVAAVTVSSGPYSSATTVVTLETAPSSPPLNLLVTEITSTSFVALWDAPLDEDHNGELQEYTIILTRDTETDYLKYTTDENVFVLEDLIPYTKYDVIVAASTQEGIGPFTEVLMVQTEEDAPSVPPDNITVEAVLSSSIQLQWSSPGAEQLNGELSHFIIKVFEEDTNTESYVISTSTSYTLETLHPYYIYRISITAATILPGPYSEEVVVRTLEDGPTSPPLNISAKSLSSTAINVRWDLPPYESRNGIIRHYTCYITARQPWINVSQTFSVNGTEVNLTELIPHTMYHIRVQAVTILPGPYSASQPCTTQEAAPSQPPVNISIFVHGSTVVEVTWIPPALMDLNGEIRHFVLKLHEKNSSSEDYTLFAKFKRESSPALIDNLHPFYDYYLVVAVATVAPGPYSERLSWKMPEDAPSSHPLNIMIRNVTSSEFLIQWMPPVESSQNGIIRGYFIQLMNTNTGESEKYNMSGEATSLSISSLHPAYTYVIEMAAMTIRQGPFSDDIFVTMKEDVPTGPPEELNVHIRNASHIEAFWHPPNEEQQNGAIISYELNISTSGQQVHHIYSNSTRTVLPLLIPHKEYSISVAASTHVGTGPFTAAVIFDTPETAPTGPPNNISISSITSTSFTSKWLLPLSNVTNGHVRYFVTKITENETEDTSEIRVYETIKTFVGLHPYYTYIMEIAAYTVGLGPYSQSITVITLESGPSAPPRAITLSHVGSRYFNASWEPPLPPKRNGVIRHYRIILWRNNSLDEPHVAFTTNSHPSISISPILPYRVYFLAIAAITNEQGPESSPIQFQTLEDAPSSAPLHLQASNITSRTLLISWSAPEEEEINGILRNYHLSVSELKSSVLEDIKFGSTLTWYMLKDLTPFTVYQCSVSGITIDEGPATSILVRTAQEAPGLPPQNVDVQVHDSHSMMITWMPLSSEHNGVIIGYNVNITLAYMDSAPVQHFTNSTSLYVIGLVPYSTYHIEVAAVTVAVGPYSNYVYAITPESAPSMEPQNLSVSISSSTSIIMSWQLPPDGHINGILRHYHIEVLSVADSEVVHSDILDHTTLEAQIDGLHPYYLYRCSVAAVTTEDGPPANVSIQMPTDLPSGPPLSVETVLFDDTTLTVSWEVPDPRKQNGIILSYAIKLLTLDINETEIFNWKERSLEIVDLHSFYTYEIMLAATTSAGLGPYSDPVYHLMPESRPSCSVSNITTTVTSTSSIHLSWIPPIHNCWNGIITNYTIAVQSLGPQSANFFEKINSNTKNESLNVSHIIVLPDLENELNNDPDPRHGMLQRIVPETVVISQLQPFFKYTFTIYMSNAAGDSNSTSSEVISLPGREPTAPPSDIIIQVISSTSISLSCKPPNVVEWNGIISGYIVQTLRIPSMFLKEQNYSYEDCHEGCYIKGLQPYTNYTVSIAAYSDFGTGIYSINFSIQTMEDVPGQPLNLSVENISSAYLISWEPPTHPNGVILDYEVFYRVSLISLDAANTKVNQYSNKTKSLQIILSDIEPQRYIFKVRARTKIGYGDYSNEVAAPIVEALTKSIAKPSVSVAAAIGWIVVVILVIVIIVASIIKVKHWKRKPPKEVVEMTARVQWKDNQLYQDSETVEQRYDEAQMRDEKDSPPPCSKLSEGYQPSEEIFVKEEQEDKSSEEEDSKLIQNSLTFESKTVEIDESADDRSDRTGSICGSNEQEQQSDNELEVFNDSNSDNDNAFYVNADTEHMIK